MSFEVASLGSGSRGNAFLVMADRTRILVDAGFSGRQLARRLEALEVDPESIVAVIVTHEHRDHTQGIGIGARRWGWTLAMNPRTRRACASLLRGEERTTELPAEGLTLGDLVIEPVPTCHDAADPAAIVVRHRPSGLRAGIATDLGRPTTPVRHALRACEFLVLEANHDERLLREGSYPWGVKQRIGGSRGHLSNALAARLAGELAHPRLGGVLLAHLSHECNDPDLARDRVAEGLLAAPFDGVLETAAQDDPSPRFDVEELVRERTDGPQLSLFRQARRSPGGDRSPPPTA